MTPAFEPASYYIGSSTDGDVAWSNDLGWVDVEQGDTFTFQETRELLLPMDGVWRRINPH